MQRRRWPGWKQRRAKLTLSSASVKRATLYSTVIPRAAADVGDRSKNQAVAARGICCRCSGWRFRSAAEIGLSGLPERFPAPSDVPRIRDRALHAGHAIALASRSHLQHANILVKSEVRLAPLRA